MNGKRRLLVTVKKGDTLASIGRRYDTSIGWMERINRRSRSDELGAGETVVVYADRTRYPGKPAPLAAAPAAPSVADPVDVPTSFATLAPAGPRPAAPDDADDAAPAEKAAP
jgi:LysM domain